MKKLFFAIHGLIIIFSMICVSCNKDVKLNGARLSPRDIVLFEKDPPQKIYLYLYPTNSTNQEVLWSTSSAAIITVSQDGMVTPVAPGEAFVRVYQDNRLLDSCKVTINPVIHVESISLSTNTLDLNTGSSPRTIGVNILPEDATYTGVLWSSSDETVATVSSGGAVTPVGVGTAIITATTEDGGITAQCTVTVTQALIELLLKNPGFEEPDDNVTGTIAPWIAMTAAELTVDAPLGPGSQNANRTERTGSAEGFWVGNPGSTLNPHGGKYTGRLPAGNSSGLYQIINVTPGLTYEFRVFILRFRTNAANQSVIKEEFVRIKTEDGLVTLESYAIGIEENTWMEVTGRYTIPNEVTKIRFQISQRDEAVPRKSPGTLIDDAEFYEVP